MRPRLVFRKIHLVISLTVGLWLAVSALAGSLLVFGDRLDRFFHPELHRVEPNGSTQSITRIIEAAEEASGGRATRIRIASASAPAHEVWLDCDTCRRAWVDPYTAEVRGIRTAHGTVRTFLHEFHRRMFLGQTGDRVVGTAGIALVLIVITGIVLAWPPKGRWRLAFRIRLRAGLRGATYDAHRTIGLIVAPLLIVSGLTGAYFVFHKPVDALAARFEQTPAPAVPLAIVAEGATQPLDRMVAIASREFPGAVLTWITLPGSATDPVTVRFRQAAEAHPNGRTFVRVDPYRGEVIGRVDALEAPLARRALNELYPIHIGAKGGTPHRMVLVMLGLTPALFMISGVALWLWRGRSRRRAARREAVVHDEHQLQTRVVEQRSR